MEEEIKDSCTRGDFGRIWLVRNQKTIYREEKKGNKKDDTLLLEESIDTTTSQRNQDAVKTPMTPPDRIYRELGNFASRDYNFFAKPKISSKKQDTKKPQHQ
ncbi:unnamed protein product [Rhizophagus irregularis]|nr:unnamed protein product [Rhizophagus irregularis]